jgi:aminoglycoside 6'-N-acetyltransferase
MVWDQNKISFRKLQETDLPLIHRWLNTPHVSQWWDIDGKRNPDYEEVIRHFMPRIQGKDPITSYVISYDDKSIGYIQIAKVDDYPAYAKALEMERNTAVVDIFIGEEGFLYRGLGSAIIRKFLRDVAFTVYQVDRCIIDPEPENKIAIRAYEKAGFRYSHKAWNVEHGVVAYIMTINRESVHQ